MSYNTLNQEFINELKFEFYTTRNFTGNLGNIIEIDNNLTHDFLIQNNTIDQSILNAYYTQTSKHYNESDYENIPDYVIYDNRNFLFEPYPFICYGAYVNRMDLVIKLNFLIKKPIEKRPTLNGKKVESFYDLFPYFEGYAKGFKQGYENFESVYSTNPLVYSNSANDKTKNIFNYLNNNYIKAPNKGFTKETIKDGIEIPNGEITNGFEHGKIHGYIYKAWSIVFSNNNEFAPLFNKKITPIEENKNELFSSKKTNQPSRLLENKINFDQLIELARSGHLSRIDMANYIGQLTNNFETDKLLMIKQDIDFYLFVEKDYLEGNISNNEIEKKILEYNEKSKKIPTYNSKLTGKKILDLEEFFYPFEFCGVYTLKNYINKQISNNKSQKEKPKLKETELSEKIKKHFGFFKRNCPRKHKQILNDTDFEKLIEWAIWYFENDFKVPKISEPIKVVNTNKTFVQLAFKYLFKELHKSSPYPKTLFEFYQSAFIPYSKDKKSNFEAVRNNDEVKKMMQIDY